jgi:hypothetical protein
VNEVGEDDRVQHVREPGDGLHETAPTPDLGPVSRRFDPWVLVVGAVALGTYLPHGFQGLFSRDLGVYAYGARQVLAGQPPYVGIVNRAEFGQWNRPWSPTTSRWASRREPSGSPDAPSVRT